MQSAGVTDLNELLTALNPILDGVPYVFCTVPDANDARLGVVKPFATVAEREGLTLVIDQRSADQHGLNYESVFYRITLGVHSSLDAVGLTAAVSTALTEKAISANIIAGYFHDHVFVAAEHAADAMACLHSLSSRNRAV